MKLNLIAVAAAAALTAGTAPAQERAKAVFHDPQGKPLGGATLEQTPVGVLIRIELAGLPPGPKAFHIHETGRCDGKDGFKSAGGHFAPMDTRHGYLSKDGPHAGDMPNQYVGPDGTLRADVVNPRVKLTHASLRDKDGSALVIHAKPDDYRSHPAGEAGERIACAVISRGG